MAAAPSCSVYTPPPAPPNSAFACSIAVHIDSTMPLAGHWLLAGLLATVILPSRGLTAQEEVSASQALICAQLANWGCLQTVRPARGVSCSIYQLPACPPPLRCKLPPPSQPR